MKKRRYVVLVAAACLFLAGTAVVGAEDLQEGFFGFRWASSAAEYPELKPLYAKAQMAFYTAPGRAYTVNDVPISRVVYGFTDGKLFAVYMDIESQESFNHLKN